MTQAFQLTAQDCPAYVLAGGQSKRHGSDKAMVEIDGLPQLIRLKNMLADCGHDVHVVADREDRYGELGISCLQDVAPNCGPLAGLATALQHRLAAADGGWLLVLSCDQVLWRAEWLSSLAATVLATTSSVVFEQLGRRQPIPGIYHSRLLAPLRKALVDGRHSLQSLLDECPSSTITAAPNPRDWSFNTPEELAHILSRSSTE